MALIIADRIKETTTTTGTGTYTLAGAADGFESFAEIGDGNTTYYVCAAGTDFEVGIGTYTASGTTLARTTILQSSNSDAAVNWTAGDKTIFCTVPAEKYVFQDASGNTALAGDLSFGDSDKAIFGAGSDLQIYHSGVNSFISDAGTGDLFIQAQDLTLRGADASTRYLTGVQSTGAVTAFYGNAAKLYTTNTGIDVTGTVTADGLTVDGDVSVSSANSRLRLYETDTTDLNTQLQNQAGYFNIQTLNDAASLSTNRISLDHSTGNVGIGTSIPSYTLDVQDDVDTWVSRIYNTGSDANALGLLVRSDATSFHDAVALGVYTQTSYKMVVRSTGNVGIGTSSPSQKLEVNGTDARIYLTGNNTDIAMDNTANGQLHLDGNAYAFGIALNADGAQLYTNSVSRDLIFGVNETEVMRVANNGVEVTGVIDAGGPVEISSTNPTIRLFETDTTNLNTQIQNNGGSFTILTTNDSATSGSNRFAIDHATGDISFYSSSGNADLTWDASTSNLLMSDAGTITKATQTADTSSMYIGTNAGITMGNTATLENNTFIGYGAGQLGSGATRCTAIGHGAFTNGTSATGVTAVGWSAAGGGTAGSYTTAVGYDSGGISSSAVNNVAFGAFAGNILTTGDDNTNIGHDSDMLSSGTLDATCLGYRARAGSYSVSAGHQSQYSGSSGSNYCVTIGRQAGYDMDGGDWCVFMGYRAGYAGGTGSDNVGIGGYSLDALTSGTDNTGLGHQSGSGITTGSHNVCVGHQSGFNISSGSTITCVGHAAGYTYAGSSNCTNLGDGANAPTAAATNTITLGNLSISSLRCNVTSISSLSDERDKTAIEDIPYGLDFINAMRPVQFTWNRRDGTLGETKDIGFIAQELAEVEMDFSSTSRTRMVSFDNPEKWEAAPNRTYPILIKAVQELAAKCEALEARIQQLEQGS